MPLPPDYDLEAKKKHYESVTRIWFNPATGHDWRIGQQYGSPAHAEFSAHDALAGFWPVNDGDYALIWVQDQLVVLIRTVFWDSQPVRDALYGLYQDICMNVNPRWHVKLVCVNTKTGEERTYGYDSRN